MSDSDWRKAALALRNGSVSPEQFVEALGDDFELVFSLNLATFHRRAELAKVLVCVCGHKMEKHRYQILGCDMACRCNKFVRSDKDGVMIHYGVERG